MRTRRLYLLAGSIGILLLGACSAPPGLQTGPVPGRRDADVISTEELAGTHVSDAYDAVRQLRPTWLRKRGAMSVTQPSDIVVYVDNLPIGGPESLRQIPVQSILRIEFLDASTATQRWGTNHVHGAIVIRTM